jgi:hypothetical protein
MNMDGRLGQNEQDGTSGANGTEMYALPSLTGKGVTDGFMGPTEGHGPAGQQSKSLSSLRQLDHCVLDNRLIVIE